MRAKDRASTKPSQNYKATLALAGLILLGAELTGCRVLHWRSFEPSEHQTPIVMFDRYLLRMDGYASGPNNLYVEVDFVNDIRDTTHIDSLSIFVIDSLRFCGGCLDSSFSVHPETWAETQPEICCVGYRGSPQSNVPFRDSDLYFFDGKLVPGGFEVTNAYSLPDSCTNLDVSVEVQAKLLDRKTGLELERESRVVQFLIQNKKKRLLGS